MLERFTFPDCQRLIRWYVCSDCWGELSGFEYDPGTRTSLVHCTTEGCPCHGYVSRSLVDRRKAESGFELSAAKAALRPAVPWIERRKGTEELLRELGY